MESQTPELAWRRRCAASAVSAIALVLTAVLSACSTYHVRSVDIKYSFTQSDYEEALKRIESIDRGTSELLYLYEKGLLLHYQNQYVESNDLLERAELLLEELYTKSVTRELAALTITDNIAKYRGESYEAVLVNYFKILNYLYLGDIDGALVECRRVNYKLQYLIDTEGVFFTDDPFIQYLTGMVYRIGAEINDAEVSFRVALEEYRELAEDYGIAVPELLYCDALKTAKLLGDVQAADSVMMYCPQMPPPEYGTLNLFLECGFVAHLEERKVVLPVFKKDDASDVDAFAEVLAAREGVAVSSYDGDVKIDYILKIAMPVLIPTPVPWDRAVIKPIVIPDSVGETLSLSTASLGSDGPAFGADVVDNLDAYSVAAFEETYGKVLFRTIVRALTKYAAKEGASEKDETLGWLVNWFNVTTESADTRNWATLPQKILMSRLVLPDGRYDLSIDLIDAGGQIVETIVIEDVSIKSGRTVFLNHRIF
jgi:tetratricopeptide (TPR) repeat protein